MNATRTPRMMEVRVASLELEEELEPAKIALDFNVLFSCPADSDESRDGHGHFRNCDFAAQQRRSRNLRLT